MGGTVLEKTSSLDLAASTLLGPRNQYWPSALTKCIPAITPPTVAHILECGRGRKWKGEIIVGGRSWGLGFRS